MPRPVADIAVDLDSLTGSDFKPGADGMERLYHLCEEIEAVGDVERCASVLFYTMERLDGSDVGVPGPLVHTLEGLRGYEPYLVESVRRMPSYLAVWMVNRILNDNPPDATAWFELLESVLHNPQASEGARKATQLFLGNQTER